VQVCNEQVIQTETVVVCYDSYVEWN